MCIRDSYYGAISHIDHHVGRMIDTLRTRGLYDETLIVYNSDHGEYLGFHHLNGKGNRMYDPLVRVPLIVKWPGQVQESARRVRRSATVAPGLYIS